MDGEYVLVAVAATVVGVAAAPVRRGPFLPRDPLPIAQRVRGARWLEAPDEPADARVGDYQSLHDEVVVRLGRDRDSRDSGASMPDCWRSARKGVSSADDQRASPTAQSVFGSGYFPGLVIPGTPYSISFGFLPGLGLWARLRRRDRSSQQRLEQESGSGCSLGLAGSPAGGSRLPEASPRAAASPVRPRRCEPLPCRPRGGE